MSETFDYDSLQVVATELMAFFGRDVTLQRRPTAAADPARPWEGSSAPAAGGIVLSGVKAAFVSFSATDRAASPSITMKDKRVLLGVQTPAEEIDQDWEIIDDDGSVWKVVEVLDSVKPGPLQILYDLQVRV